MANTNDEFTPEARLLEMTADITVSYLSNNKVESDEVSGLITTIYMALTGLGEPEPEELPEPAVSVRASVKSNRIVCLDCGKGFKMIKRHLGTEHSMTPSEYRERWNLPEDYPLTAPEYSKTRSGLAKKIGLGRKRS